MGHQHGPWTLVVETGLKLYIVDWCYVFLCSVALTDKLPRFIYMLLCFIQLAFCLFLYLNLCHWNVLCIHSVCLHVCLYVCVCMYVCMYVCMSACMCVYSGQSTGDSTSSQPDWGPSRWYSSTVHWSSCVVIWNSQIWLWHLTRATSKHHLIILLAYSS